MSKQAFRLHKRRCGLSDVAYEKLYNAQQGCCAICGIHKAVLSVDHCHKRHIVRGLLCTRCNTGLGCFLDDPKLLKLAAKFVQTHTTGIPVPQPGQLYRQRLLDRGRATQLQLTKERLKQLKHDEEVRQSLLAMFKRS